MKREYLAALKESKRERQVTRLAEPKGSFEDFVRMYKDMEKGKNLPKYYVPATMYWLVDGQHFFGWISIRHRLTARLRDFGGHIGYWIRPKYRKKGFGTLILKLGLQKAKQLGLKKILITCSPSNPASRKIIERNGGKFLDVRRARTHFNTKEVRFWIHLDERSLR